MKLSTIVFALRLGNTYFETKIGGAAEFAAVKENTLINEVAFVIPLNEEVSENNMDTGTNQIVKERFGIICAVKNDTDKNDKAGILAYDKQHDIRDDFIKVLVNLDIGFDYPIEYAGGKLVEIDRAWMWYQYDFMYKSRIWTGKDGIAHITEREVDERQAPSQLPDLNKIWTDYILMDSNNSKNLPYTGPLPASDYIDVDLSSQVDSSDDPNPGGYEKGGFAAGFKILLDGILRR